MIEPKYKMLIKGTSHWETFAILTNPPKIIAPVIAAKTIPAIKLKYLKSNTGMVSSI